MRSVRGSCGGLDIIVVGDVNVDSGMVSVVIVVVGVLSLPLL